MKYGYFDEQNKEYVITNPATPSPWANYLGSPAYGAIISNNATGYSFVKSGANGRLIRYRFNSYSNDQPGRYIYIKDLDTNEYWSNSWAPTVKPLDKFESTCIHGTAYTIISSKYNNILGEALYYVPLNAEYEVWRFKVKNNTNSTKKLAITGFVEFTNEPNYEQDQVNLQYSLFITSTKFFDNLIEENIRTGHDNPEKARFFALAGAKVDSYCGNRETFIGNYRNYSNPIGVEEGLKNDLNYNLNSCGALESTIELKAGEEKTLVYILGQNRLSVAKDLAKKYEDSTVCEKELKELKEFWHSKLNNLQVNTPDERFNNMVNVWNSYNCFITFTWSRAASFQYCGLRNGFGYRDTVQDIQGIIHLAPDMAKDQIKFMLSAQVTNGAGLPLVKYTHKPGYENTPDDPEYVKETGHPSYRADDALWLFPTVYKYISESGNLDFLDEEIYYANNQEKGTVYDHLKRAIDFSMNNLGNHGMPAGLHADWNDCLRLGKKGESTFVAFQLYYAFNIIREYAELKKDKEYLKYLDKEQDKLSKILDKCYDEDRFIRGYLENGTVIGAKKDPEANMWLNPQSWSVISGYATGEKAIKAMDSVDRELNTPYGAMLMYKPYNNHYFDGALMITYNNCVKENAGIFSQPQGWLILAEAKLGRGNQAFKYWAEACPATYNETAEKRMMEPYVYGQFVEGKDSPFAGRCHVHWLTGTASTVMVGTVEGILGIMPTTKGLVINPSIPSNWDKYSFTKIYRGKKLDVTVLNPNAKEHGVSKITVNGKVISGLTITDEMLSNENKITIEL